MTDFVMIYCKVTHSRQRRSNSLLWLSFVALLNHACSAVIFLLLGQNLRQPYCRHLYLLKVYAHNSSSASSSSRHKGKQRTKNIQSASSRTSSSSTSKTATISRIDEEQIINSTPPRAFTVENIQRFVNTRCNGLVQNVFVPSSASKRKNILNVTSSSTEKYPKFQSEIKETDLPVESSLLHEEALHHRKGCGTWVYEGQLVNPFTGEQICEVEGIELTRHLSEISKMNKTPKRQKSSPNQVIIESLGDLQVRNLLFPNKSKDFHAKARRTIENGAMETLQKTTEKKGESSPPKHIHDTNNEEDDWEYASTMLSRKIFCYRDPKQRNKLLQTYQKTPGVGKVRTLHPSEVVSCYDTATTFVVRNNGKEMAVITEFPNRNCVIAQARDSFYPSVSTASTGYVRSDGLESGHMKNIGDDQEKALNNNNRSFEFTTYGKLKSNDNSKSSTSSSSKHSIIKFPPLIYPSETARTTKKKPPRVTWVQFGADSRKVVNERYGARESYSFYGVESLNLPSLTHGQELTNQFKITSKVSISSIKSRLTSFLGFDSKEPGKNDIGSDKTSSSTIPTVKYTRYGECPPWYGPNQMCTLELVGRRVDSMKNAPPLISSVALHAIGSSSFGAIHQKSCSEEEGEKELVSNLPDSHCAKAPSSCQRTLLQWFRRQRTMPLNENYTPLFGSMKRNHPFSLYGLKRTMLGKGSR